MRRFPSVLLLLLSLNAAAQDSTELQAEKTPAFTFGVGAMLTTTSVYKVSGTDTAFVNRLALAPLLEIRHKSGLGLIYRPYLVATGGHKGIQMHQLTASYERYDLKNWSVDASYNHYFFGTDPNFPVSPISNELYAMGSYTKPWLAPTLSAAFGFGKEADGTAASDFSLSAGVGHNFSGENKVKNTSWSLSPSLSLNAATNNNYSYLQNAKYISRNGKLASALHKKQQVRRRKNGQAATTTSSESAGSGFSINNLELGLWSSFSRGNLELQPAGSVYFPLGSADGSAVSTYWQLTLRYNF